MSTRLLTASLAVLIASAWSAAPADETAPEVGFTPLLTGDSFAGWQGATENYRLENGLLLCRPKKGGNIYTEAEYADFELRFDFRLSPGGNNGIGLRVPEGEHASIDGLEIQILDDSAEKYATLKPYQYCGSVYGVVPAERGRLRPVGEWNSASIRYVGSHITIQLNGAPVVNSDLSEWKNRKTPDGKEHPGLSHTTGRLCLCTHGSEVDFRNLRIHVIEPAAQN